jgi:hypothetical protein
VKDGNLIGPGGNIDLSLCSHFCMFKGGDGGVINTMSDVVHIDLRGPNRGFG